MWSTVFSIMWGLFGVYFVFKLIASVRLVSTRQAFIVERLGRYHATLGAGFHILVPFVDRVAYQLDLREETLNVPPQECFTKDNVKVHVDGVMYISVANPVKAAYGVTDYRFAASQLAQTTTRSVIGQLDLDNTFEERDVISSKVVQVVTDAGQGWGVTVHRYEIKGIIPPETVRNAMEKQVTAERDRRAIIARSEGEKQSQINHSEGVKAELVNRSEGERQRRVNEAQGRASEILALADATAEAIAKVGDAISTDAGEEAVTLQLMEQYLGNLSTLSSEDTSVLLPLDLTRMDDMLKTVGLTKEA